MERGRNNRDKRGHVRDRKRKEIEKSLIHKANLKRKYFKLLEKEGEKVPEKRNEREENDKKRERDSKEGKKERENKEQDGDVEKEDDVDDVDANKKEHKKEDRREDKKEYEKEYNEYEETPRKSMTYGERYQLVKKRKEQKRVQALEAIKSQRQKIEQNNKEREQRRKKLEKKTKRGQPVFAPRINSLLEKIKKDVANSS